MSNHKMITKQASMFDQTNEDLPLFSGTPLKANETSSQQKEQKRQPGLFSIWPYTDPKAVKGKPELQHEEPTESGIFTLLTDQSE